MPITSLTQSPRSFLKLGSIRKGEKDDRGVPRDLSYFRVTFMNHPRQKDIEKAFVDAYGDRPTSISVRFAYPDVSSVWDAKYECYKQGGLYASASSTEDRGLYWEFYRDPDTAEVHISGGSARTQHGAELLTLPIDLSKPIYRNSKGEPQFMSPVGRLEVVVPEVAKVAVGYFEFRPESPRDIRNISAELNAIHMIASQYGKSLLGIPFKLFRREETVSKKIGGKLTSGQSWVVHIEADSEWAQRALEIVDSLALPEIVEGEAVEIKPSAPSLPAQSGSPIENEAEEQISPLSGPSVKFAAEKWNIDTKQAAQELARKFPGRKMVGRSEFMEIFK